MNITDEVQISKQLVDAFDVHIKTSNLLRWVRWRHTDGSSDTVSGMDLKLTAVGPFVKIELTKSEVWLIRAIHIDSISTKELKPKV
ncbi:hypothetical protein KJF94_07290 [Pseudomonas hormoni]|uniref:Uncharacterized protein n=1 Tax=Pseudomonas hormoni TaxID=3093767 RepID=A0ABX8F202_9PSED|nr:hypothetical protein [Pseudomonas hormoni]QVW25370.1 hypothetical protein KJF94_07290 [Pseudomonas hormoni]